MLNDDFLCFAPVAGATKIRKQLRSCSRAWVSFLLFLFCITNNARGFFGVTLKENVSRASVVCFAMDDVKRSQKADLPVCVSSCVSCVF